MLSLFCLFLFFHIRSFIRGERGEERGEERGAVGKVRLGCEYRYPSADDSLKKGALVIRVLAFILLTK